MSAPTVYRSTDTGAPVLTGVVGSLLALLDACLVTGYGSQPNAGWSKPLANASNKGMYLQGAGSSGLNLWVDDSGSGAGGAREGVMRGLETITAVATPTGTNPFPNSAALDFDSQNNQPASLFCRKSASLDSVARAWVLVADAATFWLFTYAGDTAQTYFAFGFGDVTSYVPSDPWRCGIVGRATAATTSAIQGVGLEMRNLADWQDGVTNSNIIVGLYLPRNYLGSLPARPMARLGIGTTMPNRPFSGVGGLNPADGKIYLNRFLLAENNQTNGLRGYLRGVYQMINGGAGIIDGDTFSGAGDFAGRTFLVVNALAGGNVIAVETTAWDV